MTPTPDELHRYYSARAQEYEAVYAKPERQGDLYQIKTLVHSMFDGRRVLEVACGTGYWTQEIARRAKSVLAVDISQATLDIAAFKSFPMHRTEFKIADAFALPEELGQFDAAFAGFWWSHVPISRRRSFLLSLHDRLSPDAKVVFLDNIYVEGNSTPISHTDGDGNTYQRRKLQDGSEYLVMKNFPSERELSDAVVGLACNIRYLKFEYFWLASYDKK